MGLSMGPSVAQSIMMQLGSFQFSIATAAYQDLNRKTASRWGSQERFGQLAALQYTGPGEDSITLNGVIYPEYTGSVFTLAKMRALAGRGRPLPLISGSGTAMGRWCIDSVTEKQGTFTLDGAPRKQEFTLELKLFDVRQAEQTGILAAVTAAATGVASSGADPAAVAGSVAAQAQAKTGLAAVASDVVKATGSAISTMSEALQSVRDKAAQIGDAVAPVIAGVRGAISTAQNLQAQARSLKSTLQNVRSFGDAESAMYSMISAANGASNAGALASAAAKSLGIDLFSSGATPETISAVKQAQASTGSMSVYSASIPGRVAQLEAMGGTVSEQ